MLRRTLVVLAAALVAPALALAAHAGGRANPAPSFPVTVHAANGAVTVAKRPTRIVALSPTATEDLYAIGAGRQVVAVDDGSNYPVEAPRTKISSFRPNVEAIAALNPDLVVLSTDGGSVAALQKLGVSVLYEPAAGNLAQAYDEIRQLGAATGHTPAATKVLRGMQQKITKLIQSVPKRSRHVKVFHEISPDYYSATSATFIGQIYKLFGFDNIADAADGAHTGFPQLSAEYIVAQSPALVVLADSTCCAQTATTVAQRPGWQNVTAVKQHRVIAVNDDIAARWGPRVVKLVEIVANAAKKP